MNPVFIAYKDKLMVELQKMYEADPEHNFVILHPDDNSEFVVYLEKLDGTTPPIYEDSFNDRFIRAKPYLENENWMVLSYVKAAKGEMVSESTRGAVITSLNSEFQHLVYSYLSNGLILDLPQLQ
jgi:hypothetical protein